MNKTLRIALCGLNEEEELKQTQEENKNEQQEPEQKLITMTGPLGEVYTKALAVLFAKKNLVTDEVTMESQANDAITALVAAKTAFNIDNRLSDGVASVSRQIESNQIKSDIDHNVNAYIVDHDDFTQEDVVTAYNQNTVAKKSDSDQNYFVIDYNNPKLNVEEILSNNLVNFNLQSHCELFGMKLIVGMENFVKAISVKKETKL